MMWIINIFTGILRFIFNIFSFIFGNISEKFIFLKNMVDTDSKREQKIKEHFKFQKKLNLLNNEL